MRLLNSYLGYFMLFSIIGASLIIKMMKTSDTKKGLKRLLIIFTTWLLMMQGLVLSDFYTKIPEDKQVDYLIVLGAGLKGDRVSYTLAYRLDAALEYANMHEDTEIIVSGGQGPDEWISEGEAMSKYLVSRGLAEDRIIIEDKSTSTEENIKYSLKLLENAQIDVDGATFAIVTSNYHMYRAKHIARPFVEDVEGLSAHSPYWSVFNYMLREAVTISNEWRKDVFSD
jgi:uncharacterized SAM-binding protein YcdF (DUF218 family)